MNYIEKNISEVEKNIQEACRRAGRKREDITLIAVSKTKPIEDMRKANLAGMVHFGENKVQEIMEKYDYFDNNIKWHLIGHLQTNKVKYIIDKVSLIHSVDSLKLAAEIEKQANKAGLIADILIEVNISLEESKFGLREENLLSFLEEISKFKNINVRGLMSVAPFVENSEENRKYFCALGQLMVDINAKSLDNIKMDILSMGMSTDYEVAIEEGATHIRVGTKIFGERD